VEIFHELEAKEKAPVYYGGGSEIISMARVNNLTTKAVVDLKTIPECLVLEKQGKNLIIGASATLSSISEANFFPLLSKACGRIADHTMQCKITIGGNVCGTIIYKESLLPLLLSDCSVLIASEDGVRKVSVHNLFNQKLNLAKGEFILQFIIEQKYLKLPYFHIKKTKNEKIDYPLITLAAIQDEEEIRLAFSGLCAFPFRSIKIEEEMNRKEAGIEERLNKILDLLPAPAQNDLSGSDQYRLFVLKNLLLNLEKELES
jgi:CO/xanthine dehydrogenase FAD-binding subunit